MNVQELRNTYAKLVRDAREVLEAPATEERDEGQEDKNKYDAIVADIDKVKGQIQKLEAQEQREAELRHPTSEAIKPEPVEQATEQKAPVRETEQYQRAFAQYLRTGMAPSILQQSAVEERALQVDSDTAGGYAVVPQQFINELIQERDNMVFVRQLARKFAVPNAQSLGAPALDNDPADPTWTQEIATGNADSTMTVGKRELAPKPLAQSIRVSNKLIRAGALSIESLVRERLNYKIAVVEEENFLNGDGATEPLGVFTASNDGISTSRDVSTGNTTTEIKPDNLFEQKYALKAQYRRNAAWVFHRDAVKMIAKLKDGEGRYLLVPDVRAAGNMDRLLGFPVYESEYAPNTFTTALYVGILGDFSFVWIADALDATIYVARELYLATNQTGFFSRSETDAMPVLESAFSRVKLA